MKLIDTDGAMGNLISKQVILNEIDKMPTVIDTNGVKYIEKTCLRIRINTLFPVDAVSIVRCKDCKHRPMGEDRDDLEFPDDKCPCKCEDYWYSWKPSDDWFCGNGERKDGSENGRCT